MVELDALKSAMRAASSIAKLLCSWDCPDWSLSMLALQLFTTEWSELSPDTLWRLRTHDSLKMCVFSWNLQGSFLTPVFCRGLVQCLLLIVQHSQRCVGGLLVCAVFFLIWSMLPIFCSLCKTSHLMRLHPLDSEWLDQLVYYSVIAWWSIRSMEVHVSSLLFAFWTELGAI